MGAIVSYLFGYPDDNAVDPGSGLTGRQKRIVKETWNLCRANSVDTGVAVMIDFFKKYPHHQKVFPAFKDVPIEDLRSNKKFQAHCQNIASTLSNSFDALDDPALMAATLHITGERHGRRGQGKQDFIDMKEPFMSVLKQKLGSKFTPEVEEAWNKTIELAFSIIFQGMEDQATA